MFGKKNNERFKVIYKQSSLSQGETHILLDTTTGVNYLFATGGITVLLDKDGKPVITPLEDIKP